MAEALDRTTWTADGPQDLSQLDPATAQDTFNGAGRPSLGARGQKHQLSDLRGDQHFDDHRRHSAADVHVEQGMVIVHRG